MINQQLLDFIKSQLLKGIDKETITKELLGSGWAEQDVNEGFNSINTPVINPIVNPTINPVINPIVSNNINNPILTQNTNHSGKKVLLIIVALFIIAGGVSGYYFRNDIPVIKDLVKSKTITPINEIKQEGDTQSQIQQDETILSQQEQTQSSAETESVQVIESTAKITQIDCGKDMSCFINTTKNCSPSFMKYDLSISIWGTINQTTKAEFYLRGFNSSKKCIFDVLVKDITINLSPDNVALALKEATSEEERNEIQTALQESKNTFDERAKNEIGMTIKCSLTTNYLTELFTKWKNGKISSEDLPQDGCIATDARGVNISIDSVLIKDVENPFIIKQ